MSAKRTVVTGGWGFVGSHLVESLVARGDEVTVLDVDGASPPPDIPADVLAHVRTTTGDVRDRAALDRAVRPGTDTVYHLAAVVGVDQYLSRPLDVIDVNVTGTRAVLDAAAAAGADAVIASTSEVFGKNPAVPWREDGDRVLGSTTADRWTYASSKALAEHLTFAYARQYGLRATVVRYFNVYGPRQRPAYIVSRSVHRVLNGLAPVVYDDGRQTRCFTHVSDCVAGTLLAGDTPEAVGRAFNIGSMDETTVADVVREIAELAGADAVPVSVDTAESLGATYEDLLRRVPDHSQARRVLGWTPRTPLRTGLARTLEWANNQPWWLALPDQGAAPTIEGAARR